MYVGEDFDAIDVGEEDDLELDFVRKVAEGELINSASWSMGVSELSDVNDAGAAAHISGTAKVQGTRTWQRVAGFIEGNRGVLYWAKATIVTSQGRTMSLFSRVRCGKEF